MVSVMSVVAIVGAAPTRAEAARRISAASGPGVQLGSARLARRFLAIGTGPQRLDRDLALCSSSGPKISAYRAPLASAFLNCDFMLPMPSALPACICTLTPCAQRPQHRHHLGHMLAASGTTA